MGKVDMRFRYTSAADTAKPGYLARKFARIRQEQTQMTQKLAEQEAERSAKVRAIKKGQVMA